MTDLEKYKFTLELFEKAFKRSQKASRLYPQPNYILLKIAEEAGEIVKTGVHLAENRDFTYDDLAEECVDTMAMIIRLILEGDGVIGLKSIVEGQENKGNT